jgi:hypothetical protein
VKYITSFSFSLACSAARARKRKIAKKEQERQNTSTVIRLQHLDKDPTASNIASAFASSLLVTSEPGRERVQIAENEPGLARQEKG